MRIAFKHPALAVLMCNRWDECFGFLHTQSESTLGGVASQRLLDALGDRREVQAELHRTVDAFYSIGKVDAGELALAWSMLTCDPRLPATFRSVLPQLQHVLDTCAYLR